MNNSDCITTDRLTLRRFTEEDKEDVFALMSDTYIAEKAGFKPFKSIDEVLRFMRNWEHGAFAVTERGNDTVIGIIQTPRFFWESRVEIGYWLADGYRGLGYMTEAVEAVKSYLFDEMWWCDEIRIYVFDGNDASSKVAQKCGFFPLYDDYKENIYSPFGKVESELAFSMTRGDYEWEKRGVSSFSTETMKAAA
jgi:RimJ/RimL family protein N-acetyltransferase